MFLIRYIPDIVKPNIDNLATLCIDQIDADKLALKRKIQESLARLEQQRLVSRNGDLWFFLTNEERDVAREIGHVEVSAAEKSRLLAELIYDEIPSTTSPRCATATPRPTTSSTACSMVPPGSKPAMRSALKCSPRWATTMKAAKCQVHPAQQRGQWPRHCAPG
jgi:hypothetical protein